MTDKLLPPRKACPAVSRRAAWPLCLLPPWQARAHAQRTGVRTGILVHRIPPPHLEARQVPDAAAGHARVVQRQHLHHTAKQVPVRYG